DPVLLEIPGQGLATLGRIVHATVCEYSSDNWETPRGTLLASFRIECRGKSKGRPKKMVAIGTDPDDPNTRAQWGQSVPDGARRAARGPGRGGERASTDRPGLAGLRPTGRVPGRGRRRGGLRRPALGPVVPGRAVLAGRAGRRPGRVRDGPGRLAGIARGAA